MSADGLYAAGYTPEQVAELMDINPGSADYRYESWRQFDAGFSLIP